MELIGTDIFNHIVFDMNWCTISQLSRCSTHLYKLYRSLLTRCYIIGKNTRFLPRQESILNKLLDDYKYCAELRPNPENIPILLEFARRRAVINNNSSMIIISPKDYMLWRSKVTNIYENIDRPIIFDTRLFCPIADVRIDYADRSFEGKVILSEDIYREYYENTIKIKFINRSNPVPRRYINFLPNINNIICYDGRDRQSIKPFIKINVHKHKILSHENIRNIIGKLKLKFVIVMTFDLPKKKAQIKEYIQKNSAPTVSSGRFTTLGGIYWIEFRDGDNYKFLEHCDLLIMDFTTISPFKTKLISLESMHKLYNHITYDYNPNTMVKVFINHDTQFSIKNAVLLSYVVLWDINCIRYAPKKINNNILRIFNTYDIKTIISMSKIHRLELFARKINSNAKYFDSNHFTEGELATFEYVKRRG